MAMAASNTTEQKNKEIVMGFLEAFSAGDVPGVAARLHDEGTWWVAGTIEGLSGTYSKEQMVSLLPNFTTIYKEGALRITPRQMTAEGDRVAVEAEGYAELNNGRVYKPHYHFLFQIADGKVKLVKEYMDTHHAYATFFAS
jgi:ketosteroid isomerase-like protein